MSIYHFSDNYSCHNLGHPNIFIKFVTVSSHKNYNLYPSPLYSQYEVTHLFLQFQLPRLFP